MNCSENAVFSIADEMAVTILRTTYSGVLKSVIDYSTAGANAEGTVIAQSLTQPCHLGSIPIALKAVIVWRIRTRLGVRHAER